MLQCSPKDLATRCVALLLVLSSLCDHMIMALSADLLIRPLCFLLLLLCGGAAGLNGRGPGVLLGLGVCLGVPGRDGVLGGRGEVGGAVETTAACVVVSG